MVCTSFVLSVNFYVSFVLGSIVCASFYGVWYCLRFLCAEVLSVFPVCWVVFSVLPLCLVVLRVLPLCCALSSMLRLCCVELLFLLGCVLFCFALCSLVSVVRVFAWSSSGLFPWAKSYCSSFLRAECSSLRLLYDYRAS